MALELVHRRSLAPLRRRCRPGTFLDRRSDLEVFGVIAEHACVGREVVLGIDGEGVADEEVVRDEVDLRFRNAGNASARENNPTRRCRGTGICGDLRIQKIVKICHFRFCAVVFIVAP